MQDDPSVHSLGQTWLVDRQTDMSRMKGLLFQSQKHLRATCIGAGGLVGSTEQQQITRAVTPEPRLLPQPHTAQ